MPLKRVIFGKLVLRLVSIVSVLFIYYAVSSFSLFGGGVTAPSDFSFLFSRFSFLVSRFSFLVSRFSFLVSRFSFLVSRFSFLVSRFSFLVSRFSFLVSRFSFLVSRFSFLVSRFSFLVSRWRCDRALKVLIRTSPRLCIRVLVVIGHMGHHSQHMLHLQHMLLLTCFLVNITFLFPLLLLPFSLDSFSLLLSVFLIHGLPDFVCLIYTLHFINGAKCCHLSTKIMCKNDVLGLGFMPANKRAVIIFKLILYFILN